MKIMSKIIGGILGLLVLGLLGGCMEDSMSDPYALPADMEEIITLLNSKAMTAMNEEEYETALTHMRKAIYYAYEVDPELETLSQEKLVPELLNSTFTNMSNALYLAGEYESAFAFAEKSLLMLPNYDDEYVTLGNVLSEIGSIDEAVSNYEQALELNKNSSNAHYGLGMIYYYDYEDYTEALKEFNKYLKEYPSDPDAAIMRVYTLLQLGRQETAEEYARNYSKKYTFEFKKYEVMGAYLEWTGKDKEVIAFYEDAAEHLPDHWKAQLKLGEIYYDYDEYEDALKQFKHLVSAFPDKPETLEKLFSVYSALGDIEGAEALYASSEHPESLTLSMGTFYVDQGMYRRALPYFEAYIEEYPSNEAGYVKYIQTLNWGKRYARCAEFGEQTLQSISPLWSDIPWYTGDCLTELGKDQEAIAYFELAAKADPEDNESWSWLAMAHLRLGNEEKAKEFSERALEIYEYDNVAQSVQEELLSHNEPLGARIKQFFIDNYLYEKDASKLEERLEPLDAPDLAAAEIASIIDQVRQPEDRFTFLIYGELYEQMSGAGDSDVIFKDLGDISYFKIEDFTKSTDDQFIRLLDDIPSTEEKTLVLDLRNNGGGLTESANNMLDVLLPDLVTSTLIYRDGYTYSYYSDADQVRFGRIFLFVDENTASAAEMLTLGLKTYAENVTVIGRPTFGKGVGQLVFEDKAEKVMLFAVNHYWNVMQNNIAISKIEPDIRVSGNQLESFLKKIPKP